MLIVSAPRRLLAVVALLAVSASPIAMTTAVAGGSVSCMRWDELSQVCQVRVDAAGDAGATTSAVSDRAAPGATVQCLNKNASAAVPCTRDGAVWSNDKQCYVRRLEPQPPAEDQRWQGHYPQGAVYGCFEVPQPLGPDQIAFFFWSDTQPVAPEPPPDPRVVADMAVAAMGLRAVDIGIVPEASPGSVGAVGLPVWMWVADPGPSTWGPVTRTASLRGYSVTATAQVDRVEWSMGDGSVVTCRGTGTPYRQAYGLRESPDCGHVYSEQGDPFTVTATSFWTVRWAGIGQSGVIPLTVQASTSVVVGEVQVLVQ